MVYELNFASKGEDFFSKALGPKRRKKKKGFKKAVYRGFRLFALVCALQIKRKVAVRIGKKLDQKRILESFQN